MRELRIRAKLLQNGGLPLVWIALTALSLLPVWRARMLPMLDTPNHLALIRGWHDFSVQSHNFAEFFSVRIRVVPYLLFYSSIHLLMYLVSIETANRIFLSLYLILFPLSVLAIARALKRDSWLALGAFPLAFNPSWIYGYSSLLVGNCFAFFALAALLAYLRRRQEIWLLAILILSIVTFCSHILPWFVFGLAAIVLLLSDVKQWRIGLRAAGAMLPSVLLAIAAIFDESGEHAYIKDNTAKLTSEWRDVPSLLLELPRRVLGIYPGHLDEIVLAALVLTTVALIYWTGTKREADSPAESRQLPRLLWMMALLYLILPYQIVGPIIFFQMAQRIPAMATCLFLLLPGRPLLGWQRLAMVPLIILSALLPIRLAQLYRDYSKRNAGFIRLINELPPDSKTLVVVRDMMKVDGSVAETSGDPASSGPVYWHFSSYPMALGHAAYSPHLFDQGIPIRYSKTLKAPHWAATGIFEVRQAPDFDYYLVREAHGETEREPSLKLLNEIGDWRLYQRTATVPESR